MVGVTAAIIGSAVIGAGSQAIAGGKAAKASKKAAAQQIAEARRQYDQDRADFAPWRETGTNALAKLASLYGVSRDGTTTAAAPDYSEFFASPGYQFRRGEGIKAIERSAASRGALKTGAAVKAIQRYGDGLASSEYDNYKNTLAGIAGVGQTATAQTSAAGNAASTNIINAIGNAGNARASSFANTGSAVNNGINNVLQAYLFQKGGGFPGSVPKTQTPGYGG
jgi:hypothetical protein